MKKIKLLLSAASVCSLVVVSAGSSAVAGSGPVTGGAPSSTSSSGGTVVASADWGIDSSGHKWVNVTKGAEVGHFADATAPSGGADPFITTGATPAAVAHPNAQAACHEELTEFVFSYQFSWKTEQICMGLFGAQYLKTQLWRSSWSGPRGYTNWMTSDSTTGTYLNWDWWADCPGTGSYDYYPVMQGHALGSWGPQVRSDNTVREACGTSA